MRSPGQWIMAFLALGACNPALADSTVDYSSGIGRTSNIFQDTSGLSASYTEGKLGLRGGFDLEGGQFAYGLAASARRVASYRFADQRTAGIELGYSADLGKAAKLTLKGAIEHRRSGDIFLMLPGALVGYRKSEIAPTVSAGIAGAHNGGKSHATITLSALRRSRVQFTLPGLLPARLDADRTLLDVTGGHIRPLLGGEIGATVQYRDNHVPFDQRQHYDRYPAQTLRGSLAYGRSFGETVTVMAEVGLIHVASADLGASVRRTRPFVKGEIVWQPQEGWKLTAKGAQETRLTDIDDPLGEYVRSYGVSVEKALTERLKAGLAYERSENEWLYYDYDTRTDSIAASLSMAIDKKNAVILEYGRMVRRERNPAENFTVHSLSARLAGSF